MIAKRQCCASGALAIGAVVTLAQPVLAAGDGPLTLETVRGSAVRHGRAATVTVRLRNVTDQKVTVYVRRDLITYEVVAPTGEVLTCLPMDRPRHPARSGFTTILPHHSVVMTSRLVELCPRWTFATHGEYQVRARYDPRPTGEQVGLDAYTGVLLSDASVSVRVKQDSRVFKNHPVIPHLPRQTEPKPALPPGAPASRAKAPPVSGRR